MKEFLKWLGVNEKVAKIAVWILIFMVVLIITNSMLESVGLPYYKLTYENFSKIELKNAWNWIISWFIAIANFYSIVLLVFRVKEAKPIFKYAVLYTIISTIISLIFGEAIAQICIIIYVLGFCYLYSNKKKQYILYGGLSIIFNIVLQFMNYTYKIKFIDYESLNYLMRGIMHIDYFIVIFIIILVKEIYIRKRGDKN